jgi:hypothetical protein
VTIVGIWIVVEGTTVLALGELAHAFRAVVYGQSSNINRNSVPAPVRSPWSGAEPGQQAATTIFKECSADSAKMNPLSCAQVNTPVLHHRLGRHGLGQLVCQHIANDYTVRNVVILDNVASVQHGHLSGPAVKQWPAVLAMAQQSTVEAAQANAHPGQNTHQHTSSRASTPASPHACTRPARLQSLAGSMHPLTAPHPAHCPCSKTVKHGTLLSHMASAMLQLCVLHSLQRKPPTNCPLL